MRPIQTMLFAILLLACLQGYGQSQSGFTIAGMVTDSETGETLPLANIFIANTTFGTTSKADGSFSLQLPEAGTYDLVISFLGYETFARSVRFLRPNVVWIDAKMVTKSQELSGVTVTAKKDANWARNLQEFRVGFLGRSKFGKSSRILNEEVLNFDLDEDTGVFEAWASEPLVIENKRLGYRLFYLLEDYRVYTRDGYSSFYGFTSFEEIEAKTRSKKTKYERARKEAYDGSMVHFFKSLYAGSTKEQGYEIYAAQDIEGKRVIDPNQVDLDGIVLRGQRGQSKKLRFENMLYIYFKNEGLPPEYMGKLMSNVSISTKNKSQNSWIEMIEGKEYIEFESTGYIRNPLEFYSNGYWAFEKVGDMMPINYQLSDSKRASRRRR